VVASTGGKLETTAGQKLSSAYGAIGIAVLAAIGMSAISRHEFDLQWISMLALSALMLSCSCWIVVRCEPPKVPPLIVLGLLHLIALFGEPLFEDDHYRYVWDGYQTHQHGSPYSVIPEQAFLDSSVPAEMQSQLSGINNPELPTIYGPVPQYLFLAAHLIKPHLVWLSHEQCIRLLLALFQLLGFAILMRCFKLHAHPFVWLYVLNPLLYKEVALTGHFDLLFSWPLLILCLRLQSSTSKSTSIDAVLFAICAASRITALLLLPLLLIRLGPRRWVSFLAQATLGMGALYWPLLPVTLTSSESVSWSAFAQGWEFNAGWFAAWQALLGREGALLMSALAGGVLMAVCCRQLMRNSSHFGSTVLCILAGMVLLAPVVNPWYWLWLLPLGFAWPAQEKLAPLVLAASGCVLLLSYGHGLYVAQFPIYLLHAGELFPYQLPAILQAAQHAALGIALLYVGYRYASRQSTAS
jgi:alpha-1,6-mannosyltransferase